MKKSYPKKKTIKKTATKKAKKTTPKKANPVGRPPKYKTAEALQKKIAQYFKDGFRTKKIIVRQFGREKIVDLPVITITGLVLYCGFCDRHSFYDLEKDKKFSHTIKKARSFIEREYEEILATTGNTGAIFALKNFGWSDTLKVETNETKYLHVEFKEMTPDNLKYEAEAIQNRLSSLLGKG